MFSPLGSAHHFHLYVFLISSLLFFFNDPATTEIYTLSLHDALPIFHVERHTRQHLCDAGTHATLAIGIVALSAKDRKSTRLNSSHVAISYAVFCLKKKKADSRQKSSSSPKICKYTTNG